MNTIQDAIRLDKWLWHARFAKTRKDAVTLIGRKRVRLNSEVISKSHRQVRVGDVLTLTLKTDVLVLQVTAMSERRVGAPDARALYDVLDGGEKASA